jgi:hypothetical protein
MAFVGYPDISFYHPNFSGKHMHLSQSTRALIKSDLQLWKTSGLTGPPQFSDATIAAVDSETNKKGTKVQALLNATPIDWSQIISELLPILVQLIPILISLFSAA